MTRFILLILLAVTLPGLASPLRPAGKAEALGYLPGDTAVTVPADIVALPAYCFAGCEGLRHVDFAAGSRCREIGECCFAECLDLQSVALPGGLVKIGEGCFRECRALESLVLPDGIRKLPKEMAHRCVSLRTVSLPAGLTEVGSFALAGCESLERIDLPQGVVKIGSNAFSRCRSIKEVELPGGVTSLESYAFSGCESLEKLRLPARPDMLGELIVADCPALTEIIEPSPTPPAFECESFLFEPDDAAAYSRCTLIVPARALDAYRRARGWRLFAEIKK